MFLFARRSLSAPARVRPRRSGSAAMCKEPRCRVLRLPVPDGPGGAGDDWAEVIKTAAGVLQEGGVIGVPTDTIYGIACLAQHSRAIKDIYSVKGRNGEKPLAICVGAIPDIYRYCHVHVPDQLLQDLLPGPVTLVLQRSEALSKDLNPFTPLVGVRIPNHPFIQQLAKACSGPLALTSANVSSQGSTLTVQEFQDLWPRLSLVVDGGPIGDGMSPECRLGSTVVDLSVSGSYTVVRPGCALIPTVKVLGEKYGLTPNLQLDA
ncbi:yrdC domain-containing protein, mitochondrial [Rhinatrema bivittatum]|uniref:yrdC domain-containing protein, mitochondrial n=1 Tax=Rhinatrema bivittatum TaxID=194408 RepID=UPI00112ED300|nr:yrdC domain-containing protein, mitochondrial [Rhinatrema bivittatum]